MICLQCDSTEFTYVSCTLIEQYFKDETFQVPSPALICVQCGWLGLDAACATKLQQRTADAYRRQHGLLTGDAIRALRELFGMTQVEFAHFLKVGEASVKRWETWLVQEKSSDELIRLKCQVRMQEFSI